MFTKSEIRKEIKNRLFLLSDEEKCRQENAINIKLIDSLTNIKSRNILVYMPLPDEIVITDFIKYLFFNNYNVYSPVTYEDGKMEFYKLTPSDLKGINKGMYNIVEPYKNEKYSYNSDDTIIVPLRAYDLNGSRLGRGKGYYDRFLSKNPLNTVGVAYNEQLFENLPIEEHDIPLNCIITERILIKNN